MGSNRLIEIFNQPPNQSIKAVSAVWESFVDTGQFLGAAPRDVIANSWKQSRELGIDPAVQRAHSPISSDEIELKLNLDDVGRAGKSALDKISNSTDGTKHVIVLADAEGKILYSVGHEKIQSELERINFMPGGDWSVDQVGPNGVGTPIALDRPELVFGSEHYCQAWQPWVCYGSPIHDRSGNVVGGVDITGPARDLNPEALSLAISLAHSIESGFSVLSFQRREILRNRYREFQARYPLDHSLVVDEFGYLVDAEPSVSRIFTWDQKTMWSTPINHLNRDLWCKLETGMDRGSAMETEIEFVTPHGQISMLVKPVRYDGHIIGANLLVPRRNWVDSSVSKTYSDDGKKSLPRAKHSFEQLWGQSEVFIETLKLAQSVANDPGQNNILLVGETGTGKELLAHAVHMHGLRSEGPFIAVNCGALPKDLIESELFGYRPGAFTGARQKGLRGKFEMAEGGSLFLDEIDSLDLEMQSRFLRVLEDKEITPLGSSMPIPLDVRIIAAAGCDLQDKVRQGLFRSDLYHRLNVIEIAVPSLRERPEDIVLLAERFIQAECHKQSRDCLVLSDKVKESLRQYSWPGNIRELRNICIRWALTVSGHEISISDLPIAIKNTVTVQNQLDRSQGRLREHSDQHILDTIEKAGGNISKAAKLLGINRTTIYRRLKMRE